MATRKTTSTKSRANSRSKTSGQTIHAFVEGLLARTKKPYAEIAALARKQFGGQTSPASVRHYASKMRKAKVKLPERPIANEAQYA